MSKQIKRAAWEHNIETYQGNKKISAVGLLLFAFLPTFGLCLLLLLLPQILTS